MKKSLTIIVLVLMASLATAKNGNGIVKQSKGSITFTVDKNLSPVEDDNMETYQRRGSDAAYVIFADEGIDDDIQAVIAKSFSDDEEFCTFKGKDVFFQTVVRAYAEHRPLVLSPDMVWVLISQGFARYVNAHPEEMRDKLVSHSDKLDLVVQSDKELLSEDANWEKMMADFTAQIKECTKGDIAKTITADFSTTGITERITSQITLMETMKSYFDYVIHYMGCGIPNITLTGTPKDWKSVVKKTQRLGTYALSEWTATLVPILTEFVKASEGKPNQSFWQKMVKKERADKFSDGGCSKLNPTELDGWILKLFPDENGQTLDQVPCTHEMPSERVYVDFRYQILNPGYDNICAEFPLQLVAGFIGTEVDTLTHALTPKMGWLVRQMADDDSIVKKLQEIDNKKFSDGIDLRVNRVPVLLSKLPHIKKLTLTFTSKVTLPEWFYGLKIDKLTIIGQVTDETTDAIVKHFPQAIIRDKNWKLIYDPQIKPNH